jgi:hypothetical protein
MSKKTNRVCMEDDVVQLGEREPPLGDWKVNTEYETRQVEVSLSATVNTGNFNSIKVTTALIEDFPIEKPRRECIEELHAAIQDVLKDQIGILKAEISAS